MGLRDRCNDCEPEARSAAASALVGPAEALEGVGEKLRIPAALRLRSRARLSSTGGRRRHRDLRFPPSRRLASSRTLSVALNAGYGFGVRRPPGAGTAAIAAEAAIGVRPVFVVAE
jgi:hypothetical protein